MSKTIGRNGTLGLSTLGQAYKRAHLTTEGIRERLKGSHLMLYDFTADFILLSLEPG